MPQENTPNSPLFLPPLKADAAVSAVEPGKWQHRRNVAFDSIAQSLALPEGKDIEGVCSIPDMWARPLWMEIVLTGNAPHPLRSGFKSQWKGMLAAIALAKVQGFNIRAEFLDLNKFPADKFISSLKELIPAKEKSIYSLEEGNNDPLRNIRNPWENIYLFLWNGQPVGMTSPSTLICPSADGDWTGLPWWSEGKLHSPISPHDWLTEDEKTQLYLWLNTLRSQLELCRGAYATKIKDLVTEFQKELAQALGGEPVDNQGVRLAEDVSYFGVTIAERPLAALNTPIEAKAMPSSVELALRNNIGKKKLFIIPDRQTLTSQWTQKQPKDVWIYGTTSLLNFNLQNFYAEYNRETEDYLAVSEIFLEDFYFIEVRGQLPGGLMPKGHDKISYSDANNTEVGITPLLPINPKLLEYFTPEELVSKIELKPANIDGKTGVRISLILPLTGGDYRLERDYIVHKDHALNTLPVLEVWPNFKAPGWQTYYTFYYFVQENPSQKTFQVQFPQVEDKHPPDFTSFQLSRLKQFPSHLVCQDKENASLNLGLILLKTPEAFANGDPNKTWTVGIDFGTSFTNVYYSFNKKPEPLSLSVLNLQVTKSEDAGRAFLLYDYFLFGFSESFPLATILTVKGHRGGSRTIFDGRIYIPNPDNLAAFDPGQEDIRTNLKWEDSDNLQRSERFLEHLALAIAAEAAKNNVRNLEWTISYPSSFSYRDNSRYKAAWARLIEALPAKTGLQSIFLPLTKGKYYRSESTALAHYFSVEESKDLLYSTCIDMGGGTSDISIWVGNQLIHQCSVLLAGNLLFSQFIKRKPEFIQREFKIDITQLAKENGTRAENAFYSKLNAVLSGRGKDWLREKRSYMDDDPDLQYILQRTTIGISGLYYYIGLILRSLEIEGRYNRQENTPVYIGGNASRLFHWLAPGGIFDADCEAQKLFSRMLSKGSGFRDTREETVLSSRPKAEAACGLVLDQHDTKLGHLLEDDEDPFAGENCSVNGEPIDWNERLKFSIDGEIKEFKVDKLTYLEGFLDDFHQALIELRIKSIKPLAEYKQEDSREKLWSSTKRQLENELLTKRGNVENIRKEPPFILALKALLKAIT